MAIATIYGEWPPARRNGNSGGVRISCTSQTGNMTSSVQAANHTPAFLFDFEGTLIDSVYQHVLAWHEALSKQALSSLCGRIHRRIGISGGLLVNARSRETDRQLTQEETTEVQQWHAEAYLRRLEQVRPLPGARDLLVSLTRFGTKWAIATSGRMRTGGSNLAILGVGPEVPIITCDQVARAKPDPDGRRGTAKSSDYIVGRGRRQRFGPARARRAGALE